MGWKSSTAVVCIVVGLTGGVLWLLLFSEYGPGGSRKKTNSRPQKTVIDPKFLPPPHMPKNIEDTSKYNPVTLGHPLRPITKFPILSPAAANKELRAAELVLGVVVNGEARAYPINCLTHPFREIFNDTLGGRAIAATW